MAYERRIIHYANDATTVVQTLSAAGSDSSRVTKAWFELLRQGGCGAGEIELRDSFELRDDIEPGDFIAFEYSTGVRWYFARVEEVTEESPSITRVSLYGLFAELNEVFPGGFGGNDQDPHRYAYSDYFLNDPDWSVQSWNQVSQPEEIVNLLYSQYIQPNTHVTLGTVESPSPPVGVQSILFRGEESAAAILRYLALTMKGASFGVDENGALFCTQKSGDIIATFQEGTDKERLSRRRDRSLMYNRMLLTGDYVYGAAGPAGFYRFNATFKYPSSISVHGERRIRIHLPWIRRNDDAVLFAEEFFRIYGNPTTRYDVQTSGQTSLLKPWLGRVRLLDRNGDEMIVSAWDRLKVTFDHVPIFELTVGPEDVEFPEPPESSRWEVAPPDPGDGQNPPPESIAPQSSFDTTTVSDVVTSSDSSSSGSSSTPDPRCLKATRWAKLNEDLDAWGVGTANVWAGLPGTETEFELSPVVVVDVQAPGFAVQQGLRVKLELINGFPRCVYSVTPLECEPEEAASSA